MNQANQVRLTMARRWQWVAAVAVLCLFVAGCGESTGDPNAVEVTGTVTFDGAPVKGGSIAFEDSSGSREGGPIDANGNYTVNVVPGEYKIAVITMGAPPAEMASTLDGGGTDGPSKGPSAGPGGGLPAKYSVPADSGLTATIEKAQSGLNFDLTP